MNKNWINKEYKLNNNTIITNAMIKLFISKFWMDVVNNLELENHILFLFRIKFINNQIATIGNLQKINKDSQNDLYDFLINRLEVSNDIYKEIPVSSIIFSYGIRKGQIIPSINTVEIKKYQTYYNNKLPIAFKPEEYGNIINKIDNKYFIGLNKNIIIILEQIFKKDKKVNKVKYLKNNKLLYEWVDTYINNDYFIRELGKSIYHYENYELVLHQVVKSTKPIKNINKDKDKDFRQD